MASPNQSADTVRASRDGHEYHEAWTARISMQLLWPDSELTAIAVEGLSVEDQKRASAQTVQISDIALYYGGGSTFLGASRISIVQFKYSVAKQEREFRASHAKNTIQKFSKAYKELKKKHGGQAVRAKLHFQIITNKTIFEPLIWAIDGLALGLVLKGDAKRQANQFSIAAGLKGKALADFASRCELVGNTGGLTSINTGLASVMVDWSATSDPEAKARLGQLRKLVRDKAGTCGVGRNLITRVDILATLGLGDRKDLLPCEVALVDVGNVLEREQLKGTIDLISTMSTPLLVHGSGGVGKTVFMDSVAARLSFRHKVVFFDCFGSGAYRSPHDARHLARVGLVHIANTLAFRGLCDPVIPGTVDNERLYRTFRRRLVQCVDTLSRQTPGRELILFFDAIDNAVIAARHSGEDAFPVKLLESLNDDPILGVKIVMSSRTERRLDTYAKYQELELEKFTREETASFLRARLKDVSQVEIDVAQARSQGTPRVLEHLASSDRGLLDKSEIGQRLDIDELIDNRIKEVLDSTHQRGAEKHEIDVFLAALGVLPPPVPLEELSGASGIDIEKIKSFVSDLFPLLELTKQGLMFRDEPTETLVRNRYASSTKILRRVAKSLLARQDISVCAANALPGLLNELNDGKQLFRLAFDERLPRTITSTVGKRKIRYSRVRAATLYAAINKDYDGLVRLLAELSMIEAVDQRGTGYIVGHPELVAMAGDVDSMRRLFETKSGWPGARHARLAIAYILLGDDEEASRHLIAANEWIKNYRHAGQNTLQDESGPDPANIASIPFGLLSQGRPKDAARYMRGWRDWYAYQVCARLFDYCRLAEEVQSEAAGRLSSLVGELEGIGPLAAALAFQEPSEAGRVQLVEKLAKLCKRRMKFHPPEPGLRDSYYPIEEGLRRAAAIALTLGLDEEAQAISLRASHRRPEVWCYQHSLDSDEVFSFVFRTALVAAVRKKTLHEKDVLPKELVSTCSRIPRNITGAAFRAKAVHRMRGQSSRKKRGNEKLGHSYLSSYEEQQNTELFVNHRLDPLLNLVKAFSVVLAADSRSVDSAFADLLRAWKTARKYRYPYDDGKFDRFFSVLGFEVALFAFWVRSDLNRASVDEFLTSTHDQGVFALNLVRIVSILAKREPLQPMAGEQGAKARTLIEADNDVDSRASMFGALARAILPASIEEATAYFQSGLEQLDAIGSGDFQFCRELLWFASKTKGKELDEPTFHTLTNILELNLGDGTDNFPQVVFGRAFSRTAGLRGLAKLSRWDDRSKISLGYTLLPYLTALVEDDKLAPKIALALNRLAKPREYFYASTKELANAIASGASQDSAVVGELLRQFQDENPDTAMDDTVETLVSLAEEAFGTSSDEAHGIRVARERYSKVIDIRDETRNVLERSHVHPHENESETIEIDGGGIDTIVLAADPIDENSLFQAVRKLNDLENRHDQKREFFDALRNKVSYSARSKYVRNIAKLENIFFHWKLDELRECKIRWNTSTSTLQHVYGTIAGTLIELHADELINEGIGRLSVQTLKEIQDLTEVPIAELVVEMTKMLARANPPLQSGVWLTFAALICPVADTRQSRIALERLLDSNAARLAHNVPDGEWKRGLYPKDEVTAIASGLVWRMLGSPRAEDRWRAAHSVRTFASFGYWNVIDTLVRGMGEKTAGPFQASELPFYYLHARLWLLIVLARMAIDHPEDVARYGNELLSIFEERTESHVLMRHFALRALRTCIEYGSLDLPAEVLRRLHGAEASTYPRSIIGIRNGSFQRGRPESIPESKFRFRLQYEFEKYSVDNLSTVFGKPCSQISDMISDIVLQLDPNTSSMFELGGRERIRSHIEPGIGARYHTYGEQLGWHALFIVAGKLLASAPVMNGGALPDDPWEEWMSSHCLTREDGYWLSDGADRPPSDTAEALLEGGKKGLAITGDPDKLLRLVGITSGLGNELVVEGTWHSADDVRVHIESALVSPEQATKLAQKLVRVEPMQAWLPAYHGTEERSESVDGYFRWIFFPSRTSRLDEYDPYAELCGSFRPRVASEYVESGNLRSDDPFHRNWLREDGAVAMRAQAWRSEDKYGDERPRSGSRLLITSSVLRTLLSDHQKYLLLLIKLERYERSYRDGGKQSHTVAAVRVSKNLEFKYFKGKVNHPWVPEY